MKHLLNKFGIEGLIAGLMLAFACVCMWGCGDPYYDWEDRRSAALLTIRF
ncbi:hypothetical protein BGX16_0225 [Hallerella succinigenes]|uniref:Lipoprotein n=1 Tax=Hallerella succinigenes TaxID=1896222 RepID=A0A2M9A3S4_9BACT|nr:hypothetical protein BGX16_0225 [Hallerella succinigenes]